MNITENIFCLRPKRWKEKVFDVLAKNVNERIEGNLLDETSEKMWLVRHLECIRFGH